MTSKNELSCSVYKILHFFKLLFNRRELEKTFNMWKERFYSSFPTPYYLPHFDKRFKMRSKIRFTFLYKEKTVFKTALKPLTFCQRFNLDHVAGVHSFPTVYSKPHLDNVGGSST